MNIKMKMLTSPETPEMHSFSAKERVSKNYSERYFIKYPHLSGFSRLATLYYAALLEGDWCVDAFVPRPFRIRIGTHFYYPDFFVKRGRHRFIVDIENHKLADATSIETNRQFFLGYQYDYQLIKIEDISQLSNVAENWLQIVQRLHMGQDQCTEVEENELLSLLRCHRLMKISELISPSNRANNFLSELALYRMLHKGLISICDTDSSLSFNTSVQYYDH